MSLCDKCYAPGSCCKRMNLCNDEYPDGFTFWDDMPVAEQTKDWKSFPFTALEKKKTYTHEESGRTYSSWYFSCPKLLLNGRCGDYENRPKVCRIFEPASDRLCVHFQGAEGVDLVEGL